ncbi:OST-HTH/LOTUS domain-containing protein [Chitinilyticum piscinae]|uniref:OST-HTH/LOTUS domain-containing protein n=1 Tax=Chitinilyticum piscinae TaxID=2866724 RepID=A0A8J7FL24_9NEIS|nr:OST-HTH/LOTUS domain-containing protein [Chitinilyticum piscinae]MBE9608369.1 OST-HTH/LOTUS domain-containing protein [Chitinilyticum piscinae]
MPFGPIKPLHNLIRDVQRKLGRVVLLLQWYERSLKVLLAHSNYETVQTDDGFRNTLEDNKEAVRAKTLGQLVKQFTGGDVFLPKADGQDGEPDCIGEDEPGDGKSRVRFSFTTEVSPEEFERVRGQLSTLVEMRNGLVHHFFERFDFQDEASLTSASDYLDDCYAQVRVQCEEIKAHLDTLGEAQTEMAKFFQSPEYKNYLVYGIDPSGGREHTWQWTPVVAALREAEQKLAIEGWTKLNDAINYIRKHHPEHFPNRYRFKRWDQLITATSLFELDRRKLPDNQTVVFYRTPPPEIARLAQSTKNSG